MEQYSAIFRTQSHKVAELISRGYYISECYQPRFGYQQFSYTDIILTKGREIATVTVTDKLLADTELEDPLVDTKVYTVTFSYRDDPKNKIKDETIGTFYEPISWYKYAPSITDSYSELEQIPRPEED